MCVTVFVDIWLCQIVCMCVCDCGSMYVCVCVNVHERHGQGIKGVCKILISGDHLCRVLEFQRTLQNYVFSREILCCQAIPDTSTRGRLSTLARRNLNGIFDISSGS